MGNTGSGSAAAAGSDEDGGSDYEHAYHYHTRVLGDGFESDDEEDEEYEPPSTRSRLSNNSVDPAPGRSADLANHTSKLSGNDSVSSSIAIGGSISGGAIDSASSGVANDRTSSDVARTSSAAVIDAASTGVAVDRTSGGVGTDRASVGGGVQCITEKAIGRSTRREVSSSVKEEAREEHDLRPASSRRGETSLHSACTTRPDPANDAYLTAEEEQEHHDDDDRSSDEDVTDNSLSTVTPPRTRPWTDSDTSDSDWADNDSEWEAGSAHDDSLGPSSSKRRFVATARPSQGAPARSRHVCLRTDRQGRGTESVGSDSQGRGSDRAGRKRTRSPPRLGDQSAAKRSKVSHGGDLGLRSPVPMSPGRQRYGVFDSESDSDHTVRVTRSTATKTRPAPRLSVSASSIKHAAKKAASRFLQTAKKAAQLLKESQAKQFSGRKRGAENVDEIVERVRGMGRQRESESKWAEAECSGMSPAKRLTRSRRAAEQRWLERKTVASQDAFPSGSGSRLAALSIADNCFVAQSSGRQTRKDGGRLRKSTARMPDPPPLRSIRSNSRPASPTSPPSSAVRTSPSQSVNPFENVTLIPSRRTDSGTDNSFASTSPFAGLTFTPDSAPSPVTFTSGSVWSRVNAGHASSAMGDGGERRTRRSPRLSPPTSGLSPPNRGPLPNSFTLTGQFAQSGRLSFLLEDALQVTAIGGSSITMATTSGIVVPIDGQLSPLEPAAEDIVRCGGGDFTEACRRHLQHSANGFMACQVVDMPAMGGLCPLIQRVLLVVLPSAGSDPDKWRQLLLCCYLNCLKHASETLQLTGITFPLLGSGLLEVDHCVQIFFDSLLVYLAERTPTCPLTAVHLMLGGGVSAPFAAQLLEGRVEGLRLRGVDAAMATVFRDYFNVPDFTRAPPVDRATSGKPAVKRRRL